MNYIKIIEKEYLNKGYNIGFEKIVLHCGIAKKNKDKIFVKNVFDFMKYITDQKPTFSKIKKSISNFKSKIGDIAGIYVTLRKNKMWNFYEKLISVVIPRIKEFKGFDSSSIDRFGNFNLGIDDISIFPDNFNDLKTGMNINLVIKNLKNNFVKFYKTINFPVK